jgi:hypothetical protein
MKTIKLLVCSLSLSTAMLALPALAQTASGPVDVPLAPTLSSNATTLSLSGPFMDMVGSLTVATNWGVAGGAIYAPHTQPNGKGSVGGFGVLLYNINDYVATGVGIDWLEGNGLTMPNGQVQFQAPLRIGGTNGIVLRPFAFTGIATPISGQDVEHGQVVGLFGAGLGVKLYGGLNAFYAIEQRTGQPGPWNLFGIAFSKSF